MQRLFEQKLERQKEKEAEKEDIVAMNTAVAEAVNKYFENIKENYLKNVMDKKKCTEEEALRQFESDKLKV